MNTLQQQAAELVKLAGDGSGEWPDQFFIVDTWKKVKKAMRKEGIPHKPRAFHDLRKVIAIFQPSSQQVNVYPATPELLRKIEGATAGDDFVLEGFGTDEN